MGKSEQELAALEKELKHKADNLAQKEENLKKYESELNKREDNLKQDQQQFGEFIEKKQKELTTNPAPTETKHESHYRDAIQEKRAQEAKESTES